VLLSFSIEGLLRAKEQYAKVLELVPAHEEVKENLELLEEEIKVNREYLSELEEHGAQHAVHSEL
jgi:hypothetical protein